MYAYMSQPKHQLQTFKAWAGKSSDISYYLNSHHVDFHEWANHGIARPISVVATGSTGVAKSKFDIDTEDTITLTVQWQNFADGSLGTGIYTSSWIAPKADVHSQQRFFYMGQSGEVNVDQAHRGCTCMEFASTAEDFCIRCSLAVVLIAAPRADNVAVDGSGFATCNPLFMKYTPTAGKFSGQTGYGYRSFEAFIDTVASINAGETTPAACDEEVWTRLPRLRHCRYRDLVWLTCAMFCCCDPTGRAGNNWHDDADHRDPGGWPHLT